MSKAKTAKEAVKAQEAKDIKVVADSETVPEPPTAPAKPEYGTLKAIVFERTISMRQYEPLRMEFHYNVGRDDDLGHTLETIRKFNDLIDAKFHPEATAPAPMPVIQRPPQVDNPQTTFSRPLAPPQAPQTVAGAQQFQLPTPFPDESEDAFKVRCIKRAHAVWHTNLGGREDMHPKTLGVKDAGTAIEYIKQYGVR